MRKLDIEYVKFENGILEFSGNKEDLILLFEMLGDCAPELIQSSKPNEEYTNFKVDTNYVFENEETTIFELNVNDNEPALTEEDLKKTESWN